jgi:hypothetical protein
MLGPKSFFALLAVDGESSQLIQAKSHCYVPEKKVHSIHPAGVDK